MPQEHRAERANGARFIRTCITHVIDATATWHQSTDNAQLTPPPSILTFSEVRGRGLAAAAAPDFALRAKPTLAKPSSTCAVCLCVFVLCVCVCLCVFVCVCAVWCGCWFQGFGLVMLSAPRTALPRTALSLDRPKFRSFFFPLPPQKFVLFFPLWVSSR